MSFPVWASIANRAASAPWIVQPTSPTGMPVTVGVTDQGVFSSTDAAAISPISSVGLSSSMIVTVAAPPMRKFAGVIDLIRTSNCSSGSSSVSSVVAARIVADIWPAAIVKEPSATAGKSAGDLAVPDTVSQMTVASWLTACDSTSAMRASPPSATEASLRLRSPRSSSRIVSTICSPPCAGNCSPTEGEWNVSVNVSSASSTSSSVVMTSIVAIDAPGDDGGPRLSVVSAIAV